MKKTICLLLLITMITVGCSSKTPAADTENNSDATPESIEDEYLGNATIVAMNVSLRDSPDTSSKKIDSLDFPSEVYLLEKSEATEKIGAYDDYWYKIRIGDLSGWCYGAFIAFDDELSDALESRLEDLLPIDGTSVSDSVSTLKNIIAFNSSQSLADRGAMRIKTLQEWLITQTDDELYPITETLYKYSMDDLRHPENLPDGSIKDLMEKYNEMGLSIYMTEGMYYLEPNPNFLLGNFKTAISDELYSYLSYRSKEVDNHTYSDAAVIITWDELGERMLDWENFMAAYPDSNLLEEAESMYDMYRFTFLIGTNNTPAYDYPDEILNTKLHAAYGNYMTRYPESSMTPVLEELLVLLEAESYEKTEKIMEFINPYNPWN
jgi:hypothetical protein